jgi:hypothetical protein
VIFITCSSTKGNIMFGFKNKEKTTPDRARTLGYKVARTLSDLEQQMVGGATVATDNCPSADSSWSQGCDGRCVQADC